MKTWFALENSLRDAGIRDEGVLDQIRRMTAPARCAERVRLAADAALRWVRERGLEPAEPYAAVLADLEAGGLYGGGLSNPGDSTHRHPAFKRLGKGRRHACDGGYWTSAIAAVPRHLQCRIRYEARAARCCAVVDHDGQQYELYVDTLLEPYEEMVFLRRMLYQPAQDHDTAALLRWGLVLQGAEERERQRAGREREQLREQYPLPESIWQSTCEQLAEHALLDDVEPWIEPSKEQICQWLRDPRRASLPFIDACFAPMLDCERTYLEHALSVASNVCRG